MQAQLGMEQNLPVRTIRTAMKTSLCEQLATASPQEIYLLCQAPQKSFAVNSEFTSPKLSTVNASSYTYLSFP